jgi:altronate dehydratase
LNLNIQQYNDRTSTENNMKFIILNNLDNVGVASEGIQTGQSISLPDGKALTVGQDTPASHKIALCDIAKGEPVIRYGESIGIATETVAAGGWMHTHNLIPPENTISKAAAKPERSAIDLDGPGTFMGYTRPSGPAGIRNHLLLLPTVACANGVVRAVGREFPDAVVIEHGGGCGRAGSDNDRTQRALTGLGTHPNVSAVVVIGLGCEVINSRQIADEIAESGRPVTFLSI